jgi:hypothetical protein
MRLSLKWPNILDAVYWRVKIISEGQKERKEVNPDERRMPVSGLLCLDRADGLLVVGLVCPLAAVKGVR